MKCHSFLLAFFIVLLCAGCTDSAPANPEDEPIYYDEDYFLTSADTIVTGRCVEWSFHNALLEAKINVKDLDKLPRASSWGFVYSADNENPSFDDDVVVQSRQKSKIYKTAVSNLLMDTRYYYRAYLLEGINGKLRLGRVMYFTTHICDIYADDVKEVSPFHAVLTGVSEIDLRDPLFSGECGVLYTSRRTDSPNIDVDILVRGRMAEEDSVRFDVTLKELTPSTDYVYQTYIKIGGRYYMSKPATFSTAPLNVEETDDPVDMGLSKLWAAHNVGADSSYMAGSYFAWGDPTGLMNTTNLSCYPKQSSIIGTIYDMARANMGGGWQMPTYEEMRELKEKCVWNWTKYKGVPGYAVTSRQTGRILFFPASGFAQVTRNGRNIVGDGSNPIGYYWTGYLYSGFPNYAYSLYFAEGDIDVNNKHNVRNNGYCVRAVMRY